MLPPLLLLMTRTSMVTEDEEMSNKRRLDKTHGLLISSRINKIYKPTNNNLRTSSNTIELIKSNFSKNQQRNWRIRGFRLKAEQADWKEDTDDDRRPGIGKHIICTMAQPQEVTQSIDNSGLIFNDEPMHKVQNNNDIYNVFAMENEHPEQPESSNDIYLTETSKNRNKFLESSNKTLVDKLKGEIEDF
ncbi:hypothetical protein Tco_0088067 [Tanacetum coccineum]